MYLKWSWLTTAWSISGIAIVLITALQYLPWIGFGEQGEVNFASVSWLLYNGYELYTDMDSAARYSIQHGPIIYLIIGAVMKVLGSSYISAKLSGISALFLTLFLSWIWFRKSLTAKETLFLLGLEIWILLHWNQIYYMRPDIIMLLCCIISTYVAATKNNRLVLLLGLAIPMGVMVNLKIHGIIYFLPIIAIAYDRFGPRYFSMAYIGVASLLVGTLAVAPFLLPQISFTNYLGWLHQSVKAGIQVSKIVDKLGIIVLWGLIPILISLIRGVNFGDFWRQNRFTLLALTVSLVIIVVVGSKWSSGTNHLIPFVAVYMHLLVLLVKEIRILQASASLQYVRGSWRRGCYIFLGLLLLTVTISGFSRNMKMINIVSNNPHRIDVAQHITSLSSRYAGYTLQVGYGDEKGYSEYRDFVPLPVFVGNPLLVEVVAITDMRLVNMPYPQATLRALEEGTVKVWLIPARQEPFTVSFDSSSMFDEPFKQAFMSNYHLAERSKYFDVWVHESLRTHQK